MTARGAPDLVAFLPALAVGGAERVVLQLLGDLAQRGVRCELAVAASGDAPVPAGVSTVHLADGKPLHAVPALRRYLRRRRPRTLLSSVLSANLAALIASRGWSGRPRCVVREASIVSHDTRGSSPAQLANRAAVRLLYPRADAVIALSEAMARDLQEFGVPRRLISVIPNPLLEAPPVAGPAPWPRPYLLACGRLEPQKDQATLLRAFARLGAWPHDLVILGDGSARDALLALARSLGIGPRVHLAGFVAAPAPWFRHAAAFVHTSRWEGFPNAVAEALAARAPVVATNCTDSVAQLLDGGRLGALVPVGDDAAVASAIAAVLDGTAKYPDPAAHLAQFDRGAIVQRYLDVLFPPAAGAA